VSELSKEAWGLEQAFIRQRDSVTGEISVVGKVPSPAVVTLPERTFDPKNYIDIMTFIRETFDLTQPQLMVLRVRVEKTFRAQPQVFSKRAPAPVTLNGVAIAYRLLIEAEGYKAALITSSYRVLKLGRANDPFGDVDKTVQKMMHKRAAVNRRTR